MVQNNFKPHAPLRRQSCSLKLINGAQVSHLHFRLREREVQKIDHWIQFFLFFLFRRLEYTREQLLEFKKHVDEKVGQGHGEEQGGGFGGFGGFGGGSSEVSFNKFNIFLSQFPFSFFSSEKPRTPHVPMNLLAQQLVLWLARSLGNQPKDAIDHFHISHIHLVCLHNFA